MSTSGEWSPTLDPSTNGETTSSRDIYATQPMAALLHVEAPFAATGIGLRIGRATVPQAQLCSALYRRPAGSDEIVAVTSYVCAFPLSDALEPDGSPVIAYSSYSGVNAPYLHLPL